MRERELTYSEIAAERKRLAYPLLLQFERRMTEIYPKVLPKSLIGKAISYTFALYHRLVRYVSDGRYEIDNNGIENIIRPLSPGRKNFLFCGNHASAKDTAVLYTLLGCCKAAGINAKEWLEFIFDNLNDWKANRIKELLSDNRHNLRNTHNKAVQVT